MKTKLGNLSSFRSVHHKKKAAHPVQNRNYSSVNRRKLSQKRVIQVIFILLTISTALHVANSITSCTAYGKLLGYHGVYYRFRIAEMLSRHLLSKLENEYKVPEGAVNFD